MVSSTKSSTRIFGAHTYVNPDPSEWLPLEFDRPENGPRPGHYTAGEHVFFRTSGSTDYSLLMGIWRTGATSPGCDPVTGAVEFPWNAPNGDEQVYVIEGSVTITVRETGESRTYNPGDVFSQTAGLDTDWSIPGPYFKKYFVITQSEPLDLDTSALPIHGFGD